MKIYIIDAVQRTVREAVVDTMRAARKEADIHYIEMAFQWPTRDTLYVDEEGMLPPIKQHFFRIEGRPDQPLAGNGMVFGPEKEDDDNPKGYINLDPQMSIAELQAQVTFLSMEEAVREMLAIKGPHTRITSIADCGTETVQFEQSWREFLTKQGFPIPDDA